MTTTRNTKRKDKARVVLRKGESQRKDGKYDFRWTSPDGKRHSIYAPTLEELREKEKGLQLDSLEGIKAEARYVTLNDMFTLWAKVKRGLKDNTFQNYLYLYRQFVEPDFGKSKVSALKKSDVKQFYNILADERGLQISTIDSIHTVLHQVLDMAVDDRYLRSNPSDNVLRELKKAHQFETTHRKALTVPEQNLLLSYLSKTPKYQHWYPIFAVMLGTGLRGRQLRLPLGAGQPLGPRGDGRRGLRLPRLRQISVCEMRPEDRQRLRTLFRPHQRDRKSVV